MKCLLISQILCKAEDFAVFIFLFAVFCGVLFFGVCFFHGLCTCFAQLIPFLCVKNLVSDHLKVIPVKFLSIFYIFNGENLYLWHLKTKLYILILSGRYSRFHHKTHGDSFVHCCLRLLKDNYFFPLTIWCIPSFGIISRMYDPCVQSRLWFQKW